MNQRGCEVKGEVSKRRDLQANAMRNRRTGQNMLSAGTMQ
jgi:hypothetical protein